MPTADEVARAIERAECIVRQIQTCIVEDDKSEAAAKQAAYILWLLIEDDKDWVIAALRAAAKGADAKDLRHFVDNNMTFMDVDADWPVEGPNIPTLAQVSNRIWYHATDDQTSYPFSAVIDAALAAKESPHG